MRRVLACSRCRNHKIKCVHNGEAPCTYCIHRNVAQDCRLTFPENKKSRRPEAGFRVSKNEHAREASASLVPMDAIFTAGVRPQIEPHLCVPPVDGNTLPAWARGSIFDVVPLIPARVVREAVLRVVRSFPELNVFHLPTVLDSAEKLHPLLAGAAVALTSVFDPCRDAGSGSDSDASASQWLGVGSYQVVNKVCERLTLEAIFAKCHFLVEPSLDVACALLVLSVVKWGHSEYYAAWMLHGCATRMIQSMDSEESFLLKVKIYPLLRKMQTRAFWCAFVLDKIICAGQRKTFMLPDNPDMLLPVGDYEFSLATLDAAPEMDLGVKFDQKVTLCSFLGQCRQNTAMLKKSPYAVFVYLWAIWGGVSKRVTRPDRDSAEFECPWNPESDVYKLNSMLEGIWALVPKEWKWSREKYLEEKPAIIKDNLMVTMNCVYYASTALINREYMPFLPHDIDKPVGPTDLKDPPPFHENYWTESARKCFKSVRALSCILKTLLEEELGRSPGGKSKNAVLVTPYHSFIAFTCGLLANYGANFYWMDPDAEKYNDNPSNPDRLENCYNVAIGLLKTKEKDFAAAKNWLAVVLKMDEINRYVAQNRNSPKVSEWSKKCSKDLAPSLSGPKVDFKKVEKMLPLLPPPHTDGQQNAENMYPSPVADSYYSQVGLFSQKDLGPNSTFYRAPPSSASRPASQYRSPALMAHSAPMSFPLAPTASQSPKLSFPALLPASACEPLSTNSAPQQLTNFNPNSSVRSVPAASYSVAPGPSVLSPQVVPSASSSSQQPLPQHDERHVETDTDKLSLFFNDSELDLLLQFNG
ncbi:LAQU0S01e15082g1_1 [Lachancea quebecensis]|uniref:LAQU0S01e15082g1_1 n=1 Tax=Lachancea quebecensis TaxID=1654605 RepID=A0A0N7MKY9_9SACH|nr:LAQU0S01e15082g1_1 [Lachancea quebecensis]